jgi:hypothetical protein
MKLQLAEIFGEHMVFQQHKEIPVWGRSAADDEILIELGEDRVCVNTENGFWKAVLPPREPGTGITMKVASKVTGEVLQFTDIAVGEVWLAGGQSNMEFIMKYDVDAEEMKNAYDVGDADTMREKLASGEIDVDSIGVGYSQLNMFLDKANYPKFYEDSLDWWFTDRSKTPGYSGGNKFAVIYVENSSTPVYVEASKMVNQNYVEYGDPVLLQDFDFLPKADRLEACTWFVLRECYALFYEIPPEEVDMVALFPDERDYTSVFAEHPIPRQTTQEAIKAWEECQG